MNPKQHSESLALGKAKNASNDFAYPQIMAGLFFALFAGTHPILAASNERDAVNMKMIFRLTLAFWSLCLSGCLDTQPVSEVTYQPNAAEQTMMTTSEAGNLLKQGLEASLGNKQVIVTHDGFKIEYGTPAGLSLYGEAMPMDGKVIFITFQSLANANLNPAVTKTGTPVIGYDYMVAGVPAWWNDPSGAEMCARALNVLVHKAQINSPAPQGADSAWESFKEQAASWRGLANKPSLPDEAYKFQVLAVNAVQEKRFGDAADYYEKGLEICPTWPDAQHDAALIYGELGDYGDAAYHMRCYVELMPNASDAQAARNQIIIWDEKAENHPMNQ